MLPVHIIKKKDRQSRIPFGRLFPPASFWPCVSADDYPFLAGNLSGGQDCDMF
jgi:hypothetical protein